ncbi:MAG: NAD-dependent epimerase/dehydratase family protein [Deltaproteobacteria bacterium]|nr:NAD-dependent epimerase/dehydratase family protein [Deltaproteobacteria bacterium]
MTEKQATSGDLAALRGARTFVTGATGFLGWAIADALLACGAEVRALTRSRGFPGDLEARGAVAVHGDLLDQEAIDGALEGVDYVFHVAADVRMYRAAYDEAYKNNVAATRFLVERSVHAKVKRMVFTSSGSTLGKPLDATSGPVRPVNEESAYNFDGLGWVYPPTKYLAECEVLAAVERGFDAVITHPTAIFGPGDWKKNLLPLFLATKQFAGNFTTRGTRTVCDVRDVADGHLRAALLGERGHRYALSGELFTVRDLMSEIAAVTGGRAPRVALPASVMISLGRVLDRVASMRGTVPMISEEMAMQSVLRVEISSEKAKRVLGYKTRPARESIADMAQWYRAQGWL